MTQADELFQLILSLSKSEKRYFRLFSRLGTGRAHRHAETLFDSLAGMKEYDESKLKKSIRDPNLRNNLPSSKTRLHELLLRSLRLLNSEESVDSRLSACLQDLEILFEKQLVKTARKKIRKARLLALHFEKEARLLELLAWEQRFFVLDPDEDETAFYARNEEEEKQCMKRLDLQRGLTRLYEQLRSLTRRGEKPRDSATTEKFRVIITHPDLREAPPPELFLCNALYLAIKGYYAIALGRFEDAWKQFHALMELWHSHEDRISDLADFYLGSFNNYANACLLSKSHKADFLTELERIKSLKNLPAAVKFKFDRVAYSQELSLRTNLGRLEDEDGVKFIQRLEQWLREHENQLQDARLLLFYYNITLFFFSKSEFSSAQKWLRKILNFPSTEARADIRDFARIFQLVLQYELGNLDVQEYLLRSAYRFLHRNQKLFDFEEALIAFMKHEQKTGDISPARSKKALKDLHAHWKAIQQRTDGPHPEGLQVMIFWAESRLEGVSLKEYYSRKVKEQPV